MKSARAKKKAPRLGARYLRESRAKKGERADVSFRRQHDRTAEAAGAMNVPIGSNLTFSDHNVSGLTPDLLTGLANLIEAARRLEFDHLFVEHVDRIGRDADEVVRVCKVLWRHGVRIYDANRVEATREAVEFLALAARLNSTSNGERMSRARRAKAASGRAYGVKLFGYDIDDRDRYVVNEEEARAVRFASALFADGSSVTAIQNAMNAGGMLKASGKPWDSRDLLKKVKVGDDYVFEGLLPRTANGGMRTFGALKDVRDRAGHVTKMWNSGGAIEVPIAPIVDRHTYERVHARLASSRREPLRKSYKYLLDDLMHCGRCRRRLSLSNGQTMSGRPWSRTVALVCRGFDEGTCTNDRQADMGSTLLAIVCTLSEMIGKVGGSQEYGKEFLKALDDRDRSIGLVPSRDLADRIKGQTTALEALVQRRGLGDKAVTADAVIAADLELRRLTVRLAEAYGREAGSRQPPDHAKVLEALSTFMLRMPRDLAAVRDDRERECYKALRAMIYSVAVEPIAFGKFRYSIETVIGNRQGVAWVRFIPLGAMPTALLKALTASGKVGLTDEELRKAAVRHGSKRNKMLRGLARLLQLGYVRSKGLRFVATGQKPLLIDGRPAIVVLPKAP